MEQFLLPLLTILGSVMASSGFWAYVQHKLDKNDVRTIMLIGLAHDRIISLGMEYVERGWVTHDEYENLHEYLYSPYKQMGGNGSAKRILDEVSTLPICKSTYNNQHGGEA